MDQNNQILVVVYLKKKKSQNAISLGFYKIHMNYYEPLLHDFCLFFRSFYKNSFQQALDYI